MYYGPCLVATKAGLLTLTDPMFGAFSFFKPWHITGMELSVAEAPTGADIKVDLATPADTATGLAIATLTKSTYTQQTIFATEFLAGANVAWQLKLTQVGSTYAGSDLRVRLLASPYACATWVVINLTRLQAFLADQFLQGVLTKGLATGQASPDTVVINDVLNECRGDLRANSLNQISSTAYSLPPEAINPACWRIVEALQARLPASSMDFSETQKQNIKNAHDWFEKRRTELTVQPPPDPELLYNYPVRGGDDGNGVVGLMPGLRRSWPNPASMAQWTATWGSG